jgi:hypothetical protein
MTLGHSKNTREMSAGTKMHLGASPLESFYLFVVQRLTYVHIVERLGLDLLICA